MFSSCISSVTVFSKYTSACFIDTSTVISLFVSVLPVTLRFTSWSSMVAVHITVGVFIVTLLLTRTVSSLLVDSHLCFCSNVQPFPSFPTPPAPLGLRPQLARRASFPPCPCALLVLQEERVVGQLQEAHPVSLTWAFCGVSTTAGESPSDPRCSVVRRTLRVDTTPSSVLTTCSSVTSLCPSHTFGKRDNTISPHSSNSPRQDLPIARWTSDCASSRTGGSSLSSMMRSIRLCGSWFRLCFTFDA